MIAGLFKSIKKSIYMQDLLDNEVIIQNVKTVTGKLIQKQYIKKKLLGSGAFAMCYITQNIETKKLYATKIIAKENRNRIKLLNQLVIHQLFHHPNIVDFSHAFEDQFDIFVFLELCPNNSLEHLMTKRGVLRKKEIQKILYEIIQALIYIHSKNVIHRDIKPRNIFLGANNEVKVGDFGLAIKLEFEGERKRNICGTPQYMAPEMIQGCGYGKQIDIWAVGILLYEIYTGKTPYVDDTNELVMERIIDLEFQYSEKGIPKDGMALIKRILIKNPQLRPTLEDILESPFFNDQTGKSISKMEVQQVDTFNINFQTPKSSKTPNAHNKGFKKYNRGSTTTANKQERSMLKNSFKSNHQELQASFLDQGQFINYVTQIFEIGDCYVAYQMNDGSYGVLKKDIEVLHENLLVHSINLQKRGHPITVVHNPEDQADGKIRMILQNSKKKFTIKESKESILKMAKSGRSLVYLAKSSRHRNTFMLRLSNGNLQVKFTDKVSILINIKNPHANIQCIDSEGKITEIIPQDIMENRKQRFSNAPVGDTKAAYVKGILVSLGFDSQKRTLDHSPRHSTTKQEKQEQILS